MSDSGTDLLTAFIISQIGAADSHERRRADDVRDHIIRPACAQHGVDAFRADDEDEPGRITSAVVRRIIEADLIIADLTGQNLNVYFELGIAQAFGKRTALLIDDVKHLPFDTRDENTIEIGSPGEKLGATEAEVARERLASHVGKLLKDDYRVRNLVTEVAELRQVDQLRDNSAEDAPLHLVLDRLAAIEGQLSQRQLGASLDQSVQRPRAAYFEDVPTLADRNRADLLLDAGNTLTRLMASREEGIDDPEGLAERIELEAAALTDVTLIAEDVLGRPVSSSEGDRIRRYIETPRATPALRNRLSEGPQRLAKWIMTGRPD